MIGAQALGESAVGDYSGETIYGSLTEITLGMVTGGIPKRDDTVQGQYTEITFSAVEGGVLAERNIAGEITPIEMDVIYPLRKGRRTLPVIDLTGVGNVDNTYIGWETVEPAGTNVRVQARLDGGTWVDVDNGGTITPLVGLSDTLGRKLYIRQILESDDTTTTPEIEQFRLEVRAC